MNKQLSAEVTPTDLQTKTDAYNLALMQYIEAKLIVAGSVQPNDLCLQFRMHRTTASALIRKYRDLAPDNTTKGDKRWVKTEHFKAIYLTTKPETYLRHVKGVFGNTAKLGARK